MECDTCPAIRPLKTTLRFAQLTRRFDFRSRSTCCCFTDTPFGRRPPRPRPRPRRDESEARGERRWPFIPSRAGPTRAGRRATGGSAASRHQIGQPPPHHHLRPPRARRDGSHDGPDSIRLRPTSRAFNLAIRRRRRRPVERPDDGRRLATFASRQTRPQQAIVALVDFLPQP